MVIVVVFHLVQTNGFNAVIVVTHELPRISAPTPIVVVVEEVVVEETTDDVEETTTTNIQPISHLSQIIWLFAKGAHSMNSRSNSQPFFLK